MSVIDTAIARLQALALTSGTTDGTVTVNFAPNYPVEDSSVLPMAITHIISGTASLDNATTLRFQPTVAVDFLFSRLNLKQAYTEINTVAVNFAKLLGGDPTLNSSVDTINFPVQMTTSPVEFNKVILELLRFEIPLKTLETPTT